MYRWSWLLGSCLLLKPMPETPKDRSTASTSSAGESPCMSKEKLAGLATWIRGPELWSVESSHSSGMTMSSRSSVLSCHTPSFSRESAGLVTLRALALMRSRLELRCVR